MTPASNGAIHRVAPFEGPGYFAPYFITKNHHSNHHIFMKKSIHPVFGFALLLLLGIVSTGCPVGIAYPLCEATQIEKVDKNLLGTWKAMDNSADILQVKIGKEDEVTYNVEVLEKGENYMVDEVQFFSWATKLDGHSFLFSKASEGDDSNYYLYHIVLDKKRLIIEDMGLLVGGVDAVTSTEAFRQEVSASLKMPDCLSARFEYSKQ